MLCVELATRVTAAIFDYLGISGVLVECDLSFTPESRPGASKPKYMDEECFGKDYRELNINSRFTINHVIEFYYKSGRNPEFFNDYFNTLAGNDELQKQIEAGLSEEEIRVSWLEELNHYKMIRKNYLLYPDGNI